MFLMQFVFILAVGAVAGWIASQITGQSTKGLAADTVLGVVGAALATLIMPDFVAWGRLPAVFSGAVFFAAFTLTGVRFFRMLRIERRRGLSAVARVANS